MIEAEQGWYEQCIYTAPRSMQFEDTVCDKLENGPACKEETRKKIAVKLTLESKVQRFFLLIRRFWTIGSLLAVC